MNNPYEILEIKPGASDTEIKAAYKRLVKKYHPDKYQNNPLADLAEEKLQEVNEAYDYLMKNKGAGQNTYHSAYGGQSGGRNSYKSPELYPAREAIDRGDLHGAEQILVNASERGAEWFFLSGVLSFKKGWVDDGLSNVRQAIDMDPDNPEYQNIYRQMMSSGMMYRGRSNGEGYQNANNDACSRCCTLYLCSSCISPCW